MGSAAAPQRAVEETWLGLSSQAHLGPAHKSNDLVMSQLMHAVFKLRYAKNLSRLIKMI